MPTYEFKCLAFDHRVEAILPMGSNTVPYCPHCGSETKKVFSPVAVSFKGSGFYSTDKRTRRSVTAKVTG